MSCITLVKVWICRASSRWCSAGELPMGSKPLSLRLLATLGSRSASRSSVLILSTTALGVPAGA